ncbi:heavy metal translocating P-type ATPase [Lentibacillus salicampi]|uniref:Cadmium-translocating P-type ATPase n=1 Tax=Lentibacillus salicampi TaxID=175306 RepID=A0A4Y9A8W3_9BACI|nr:heavy metal translocating P-type ATPase [Lentibacillus salicampi]TFJ91692.1 cadmium-translocating P-type ATPase [Lentibacillus salicampi]
MTSKSKPLASPTSQMFHPTVIHNVYKKISEHAELIAALFSGLLILVTWAISNSIPPALTVILYLTAFVIGGYAKAKEGIQETIANKELNVEMLMVFAAIGSASIGYWTEGAILIFIFALSGALETYTMQKSNKEISSLMDLQPERALRISNGHEKVVPVSELQLEDIILVRAGERVPADGVIIKGTTAIDESAITGESVPVTKLNSHDVFAGTVALDGSISVKITKPANETLFQKIIQMVQSAQEEKSPSQLFIEHFEGTYVKVVLATVAVMMFLPYFLFGWSLSESIYRAMILLVVASPCALVASIMPATLSAISSSAKNGVLFKGGVHVENLSHVKAIAFDKTGTLTNGTPEVTEAFVDTNADKETVLAIAGAIERESTHPLAQAITAYSEAHSNGPKRTVEQVTTVSGNGVTAYVDQEQWKIGKAAFVGESEASCFHNGIAERLAKEGKTVVFVKHNDNVIALYALKDTIRNDTKQAIKALKKQGVYTIMLTGDNETTAKAIAQEAGIDHYIAECLPEEKVTQVKQLRTAYKNVAMVGDGINDAPALASANLGIAMGKGTDVALETADVVLMKNDLPKITNAIHLSSRMNKVVGQNVIFSLGVIVLLIASNFLQVLDLPLGVIGHEGSTILVILNGLRLLK